MGKKRGLVWLFACFAFLVSCGSGEETDRSRVYNIYALNKEETRIFSNEYEARSTEQSALIEELLAQLTATPEKPEYRAPLAGNFELIGYSVEEKQLILNFDEQYKGSKYVRRRLRILPVMSSVSCRRTCSSIMRKAR